jgi:hypothetical protein
MVPVDRDVHQVRLLAHVLSNADAPETLREIELIEINASRLSGNGLPGQGLILVLGGICPWQNWRVS